MTRVGPRVAPLFAGDNGAPTVRGGVGQEGRKKSDKTMERNLNYAPRKMAIVCKAMLIQRSRKRGGAADFADADKLPLPRYSPTFLRSPTSFLSFPCSLLILSPFPFSRRRPATPRTLRVAAARDSYSPVRCVSPAYLFVATDRSGDLPLSLSADQLRNTVANRFLERQF